MADRTGDRTGGWDRLFHAETRLVAGLMSGTSLDGVDAALARIHGSGADLHLETLAFREAPYPEALRALLLQHSDAETSSVRALTLLNARLAHVYADAVRALMDEAGLPLSALDLVGSHGQTVHHVPEPTDCGGQAVTGTLQIGDPSALAHLLGVPVVGQFRNADMALGGQGAPLVPYFDYACFTDVREARGLLNLGGIANLTVLPPGTAPADVTAFDTGPANMVLDALATRCFDLPYDRDGALARSGSPIEPLLRELLADPYFAQAPPKSTGRERYGAPFVERLCQAAPEADPRDLLATAAHLTARSVHQAYERFIAPQQRIDVLLVSGGGVHNAYLMDLLAELFAPMPVRSTTVCGVDPDAKEALCFAVLAHETANGRPTGMPPVTGATRAAVQGVLCLPG